MKLNTKYKTKARKRAVTWRVGAGAALTALLLTGCGGQVVTFGDMGASFNRSIMAMSLWAIALSIIIFFGVSAGLFYTVHKFREENNSAAPEQFHGNNRLEVILVLVPVFIVILLSVLAVRTMANNNPVSEKSLQIDSLGRQFWWNFSYPASKVQGGVVTNGNEMVMPVGEKVAVSTTSGDVVHGFWAPNIGGQRAAIPNSKKVWNVDTDRAGVYQGNCSQLCGGSHANMRFKVIALPKDRFTAFMNAATAYTAPTPAAGSAEERGMTLFMQGKASTGAIACASCHRVQGTPANGASGPDLSFFGSRRTLGAGMWEAMTPAQWEETTAAKGALYGFSPKQALHEWIKHNSDPKIKPGSLMPRYDGGEYMDKGKMIKGGTLTDPEIEDIAAYLRSLKLPAEADYWQGIPVNGTNTTAGGTQ